MVQWHMHSDRKISGGHNNTRLRCDKKLAWKGGIIANTRLASEEFVDVTNARGSVVKLKQKKAKFAYVVGADGKKIHKAEILSVKENPADRQLTRENIITKGAIIKIKLGDSEKFALVTSRPGQAGVVHGKILTDFKDESKQAKKEKAKKEPKEELKPTEILTEQQNNQNTTTKK